MGVKLFIAPAAAGKTEYALALARACAAGLAATPRVIVASALQRQSWHNRLALSGGAIGVRVSTFDAVYAECLNAAGQVYITLDEPVQYRVLRAVVDELGLKYYAPLVSRPGFISAVQQLIAEWKAARIWPDVLANAFSQLGDEPRLRELAEIYAAYQQRLQDQGWADRAGLAWLAVEALECGDSKVAHDWPLVIVDGFDDFTKVQLALLRALAERVGELVVTLTGCQDGHARPLVHRRFCRTRKHLERELNATAAALPTLSSRSVPALAHLEKSLHRSGAARMDAAGVIDLIEAPDRMGEVRAALRWLKERILVDGMRPREVALLMRDVAPYRALILQTAQEFGLPVRLASGLPLASNPVIAALRDLLRLVLPLSSTDPQPSLPRRLVVEAWRSPYFDWSAWPAENASEPIGIAAGDAERLDVAARWARVIGGLGQWEEGLEFLSRRSRDAGIDDEERDVSHTVPVGQDVQELLGKLRRFVQRLTPPVSGSMRDFALWLETLIGSDPELRNVRASRPSEPTSLRLVARAREARAGDTVSALAASDVSALRALKNVLRGLVWAEEAMAQPEDVDWPRFLEELDGAMEATSYPAPLRPECEEILVADVVAARGVPFRAVAIMGLAEGEFPKVLSEDPFLRDHDRQQLSDRFDLAMELPTESAEHEFFYEAVTRARDRLLCTRPRLAENGADWQPSPLWEELTGLFHVQPQRLTAQSVVEPDHVASWPELLQSLALHPQCQSLQEWARRQQPERCEAFNRAAHVLRLRAGREEQSEFEGDLGTLADDLDRRYCAAGSPWSASRLETYRCCPFRFFVQYVLGLEPREEPQEGLDVRQLGSTYHRILELVYQSPEVQDKSDLDQLLAALPDVAAKVLDEAPAREGFRATAWWQQTRREMVENVHCSLQALHAPDVALGFVPAGQEQSFDGNVRLSLQDGEQWLRLRGVIDRVERRPDGKVRIIDYKTAGPSGYDNRSVAEGKKMQLPLYALAARDVLQLGEAADGFYWHVRHAERSSFTLRRFQETEGKSALQVVGEVAWEVVQEVRRGAFKPNPPDNGCPTYCPAAAFCWHFFARYRG